MKVEWEVMDIEKSLEMKVKNHAMRKDKKQ
jgi:hypothetical protein